MAKQKNGTAKENQEEENQMDLHSANPGDRMKHPLNSELLKRTEPWPSVCYSETHSGAGIYKAELQDPRKPHITDFKDLVDRERSIRIKNSGNPRKALAGDEFFQVLTRWWDQENNSKLYPGSARQALEFLLATKQEFEFRLTENGEKAFTRLETAMAIGGKKVTVKQRSFHDEREWLLEPDHLLLVVDPFAFFHSFDNLDSIKFGLHRGHINFDQVQYFLNGIEKKENAIIHFWWPSTRQGKNDAGSPRQLVEKGIRETVNLFKEWESSDSKNRCYQAFKDGHNHKSSLIGIGGGASIVRDVSGLDWKGSWLSPYIKPLRE